MSQSFDVVTDNRKRINHFVAEGHPEESIQPVDMINYLDGGEMVTYKGEEYDLTPNGSLVHPEVEVAENVFNGEGVIIGGNTIFDAKGARIVLGNNSRVDSSISGGVEVGAFSIVKAREIGTNTTIGDHNRIGLGTEIGNFVKTGLAVKIDELCLIASGVLIGKAAKIGFETRLMAGVEIGHHAKIGEFTGAAPRGYNQGGEFVTAGRVVPPYMHLP